MALIKCPECGKEVSDSAKSCPNCGYPIAKYVKKNKKPSGKKKSRIIIIIVVCFVAIVGIVSAVLLMTRNTQKGDLIGSVALGETDSEFVEYIDEYSEDETEAFSADGIEVEKASTDPSTYRIGIKTPLKLNNDFDLMFKDIDTYGIMDYFVDEDGVVLQKSFSTKFLTYDVNDSPYSYDSYYNFATKTNLIISSKPDEDTRLFLDKLLKKIENSYGEYSSSEAGPTESYQEYETYIWEERGYNILVTFAKMYSKTYGGYCEITLEYDEADSE